MPSAYGMLLDRGLTVDQLDLAREVGTVDSDPATNRRTLAIRLRDVVSDQEAEGKTKKCLTRVWLNPPTAARPMIQWALTNPADDLADGLFHFGALLATYPFVGVVARVVGQTLATEGSAPARAVRKEVCRTVGDRPSVDVAARKAYTTMTNLGVLGQDGQVLTGAPTALTVPPSHAGWFTHALILTRQATAIAASSAFVAPELLGAALPSVGSARYGLLARHTQTDGAVFAV